MTKYDYIIDTLQPKNKIGVGLNSFNPFPQDDKTYIVIQN